MQTLWQASHWFIYTERLYILSYNAILQVWRILIVKVSSGVHIWIIYGCLTEDLRIFLSEQNDAVGDDDFLFARGG